MRVALGVTGSIAARLTAKLVRELMTAGQEVCVVTTPAALAFFKSDEVPVRTWTDEDEWTQASASNSSVLHIDIRRWADMLLIAPLSANTLAKMANGLCDNLLTCLWRAWEPHKPVIIAPAMNTAMWENPFTRLHLTKLTTELTTAGFRITVVSPVSKLLACGDTGMGAMAATTDIVAAVLACQ